MIVDGMKHLLDRGSGRGSAKCKVRNLMVGYSPLEVREEDIETVVVVFKAIFPHLRDFTDRTGRWHKLKAEIWIMDVHLMFALLHIPFDALLCPIVGDYP